MKNAIFDVKMNPKYLHHFSLLSIEIYSMSVGFKVCAYLPAVNDTQPYFISQHFITMNINFLRQLWHTYFVIIQAVCVWKVEALLDGTRAHADTGIRSYRMYIFYSCSYHVLYTASSGL